MKVKRRTARNTMKKATGSSLIKAGVFIALVQFFLLIPCSSLRAQEQPADAATIRIIREGVAKAVQETSTMTAAFTQEKEMSMLSEKIVSNGRISFKKEKMLRWEYIQPVSYIIVIRNDQISVKDNARVSQFSVTSSKVFREVNRIIMGSIQGTLLSDDKNFSTSYASTPGAWVVKLKPLSPKLKETLSEITILFDRKTFTVTRVDLAEPGGDHTKILFSDKKFNQPLPDEIFMVH